MGAWTGVRRSQSRVTRPSEPSGMGRHAEKYGVRVVCTLNAPRPHPRRSSPSQNRLTPTSGSPGRSAISNTALHTQVYLMFPGMHLHNFVSPSPSQDHTDFWITREQYREDPAGSLRKLGVA